MLAIDNMQSIFFVNSYSKVRFVALYFLIISFPSWGVFIWGTNIMFLIFFVSSLVFCIWSFFKLPKVIAKRILKITLSSDEGVLIECEKPYLFAKKDNPIQIPWSEIKSYIHSDSNVFSTFFICLKNGKKVKFHTVYFDDKDDYDDFYIWNFPKYVSEYNKNSGTETPIIEEISLFQRLTKNKVFAISIYFLITVATVAVIFCKADLSKKLYTLGMIAPLVWVARQLNIKGEKEGEEIFEKEVEKERKRIEKRQKHKKQ